MATFIERLLNSHKSRTQKFFALLAVLTAFFDYMHTQLPAFSSVIPDDIYKNLLMVSIGGGIVLRFLTTDDLRDKG